MINGSIFLVVLFVMFAAGVGTMAWAWVKWAAPVQHESNGGIPPEPPNEWAFINAIHEHVGPSWDRATIDDWFRMLGVRYGARGYDWSREGARVMAAEFLDEAAGWS